MKSQAAHTSVAWPVSAMHGGCVLINITIVAWRLILVRFDRAKGRLSGWRAFCFAGQQCRASGMSASIASQCSPGHSCCLILRVAELTPRRLHLAQAMQCWQRRWMEHFTANLTSASAAWVLQVVSPLPSIRLPVRQGLPQHASRTLWCVPCIDAQF